MAKNITLLGADYPDVPAVQLPQTGGGTATFYDIEVIDNLTSTSTTDALSANQGKVLNDKFTQVSNTYNTSSVTLAGIQADADNIAGDNVGIFNVGYMNGAVATAIGISGAGFVILHKHSDTRAMLEFLNITTGQIQYCNKVGSSWSNTIITP